MGYLGEEIPKLGFGLMRLPRVEGEIDIEQVKEMVDLFLDAGLTYFDTARGYQGSEAAIRKALVERYPRESFQLASKNPAWAGTSCAEDAYKLFDISLEESGAGYFDFYMLHNVGDSRTAVFEKYGIWDFVAGLKEKGLVKHIGFSFHDNAEQLEKILTAHPEAEFVQLQLNYADWVSPTVQARECYETVRRHGKSVIIMEPVRGGALANPPQVVSDILKAADPDASPVDWALRFAMGLEGVITILSGMSNVEQMRENIETYKRFKPLDADEQKVLEAAQAALSAIPSVPCTACKYCLAGCPQNIDIPNIFTAMNRDILFGATDGAFKYGFATSFGGKASDCIECGACEDVCPQHIAIIDELKKVVALFE